jgi:hypothetical protein
MGAYGGAVFKKLLRPMAMLRKFKKDAITDAGSWIPNRRMNGH